ncbi:MAG: hypothetical protein NTX27_07575, partial [Verrucomicrobia bacterium]|nr:hypothetical protein [Verrucomicrobiota bacterium]
VRMGADGCGWVRMGADGRGAGRGKVEGVVVGSGRCRISLRESQRDSAMKPGVAPRRRYPG